MARFVCRRGGEGAWWIGRALSGSSSGVTYWRSLFAVEWSVLGVSSRTRVVFLLRGDDGSSARTQGCLLVCGQGLFVVLRLRLWRFQLLLSSMARVCCALHDALHLLDHLTYQPGLLLIISFWKCLSCLVPLQCLLLASPARSSSEAQEDRARFSSSREVLSALSVTGIWRSISSSVHGSVRSRWHSSRFAISYILPFGLELHGQSRYKCWGDYQNLATPAMSRGVEESASEATR
ncbi:hypothetical protein HID58_020421 [Brassica napus]|uniref:Uncharacterized protein n=1 Tax=Brassica napus TaxID=3708 RepID=A0ABQ7XII1_BRANA|nr:hypothetical protein HID58_020421 [Brassica napus]